VRQSLGGEIPYDCKVKQENFNEMVGGNIKNRVEGILQNAVNGSLDLNRCSSGIDTLGISEESLRIRGGRSPPNYVQRLEELDPEQLREWQLSIPESIVELHDGLKLIPYHEVMESGPRAAALKKATQMYLENKLPCKEILRRNEFAKKIVRDVTATSLNWFGGSLLGLLEQVYW